ncbi:hypothetical protein [Cyclobacterium plantarum]|uniref:hypothetical protein n=1 Tax=Cyclobacterium plantarum TaxID=2716263 RepID=UPI003F71BDDD
MLHSETINKYYVGQTEDTSKRLSFHNDPEKNNTWTHCGIPWVAKISMAFPPPAVRKLSYWR